MLVVLALISVGDSAPPCQREQRGRHGVKLAKQIKALLSPGCPNAACKAAWCSLVVAPAAGRCATFVRFHYMCCCDADVCAFNNADQKPYPHLLICSPLTHCHSAFGECLTTPPFSKYLILLTCSRSTFLLTPGELSRYSSWCSSRCRRYLKGKSLHFHEYYYFPDRVFVMRYCKKKESLWICHPLFAFHICY